ncbi:M20 family metallopeptidase [Salipiger sp. P9]|uniref:M20 aminoacylase family protein n=1 Tax=Salipiger pentaromativorans TaxID=2943193 RepID=UPI0021586C83|nr:M20 aminoacylase family protein [Salipiger pentaromativorans]MCR8548190.1 M20 family metallopeptidase [Salipiger pentaromativorans]
MTAADDLTRIAQDATGWRRALHEQPELLYDLPKTSAFVAGKLRAFGVDEVATGIAGTGVVGLIRGAKGAGPVIGLRADMDALPMDEKTNLPYASKVPGMMHACGHDGHTATLLGAAQHLAATRDFAGTVALIFQPAEEGGAGARAMIEEGLLERFGIESVYAMHNQPGLPVGAFATRPGALLAGGDRFVVTVSGRGGHASAPTKSIDPVVAASHLIAACQTLVSRFSDPFDQVVVSITYLDAGSAGALNVIPDSAVFGGTIRTMNNETRKAIEAHLRRILKSGAEQFSCEAELDWRPGYPVTVNDPGKTALAVEAAQAVAGAAQVETACDRQMGSEDFSYMLEQRPGAMVWFGNGESAELHNPAYNFNDDAILPGMRYWVTLVARELGAAA